MQLLIILPLLLILLLFALIIELAIDRIIIMCLRKCFECLMMQFINLCPCPLFVVLIIDVINYVELFFVVIQQLLLFLYWKPHLAVLEEDLGQLLVVYYVIGIANWGELTVWNFLGVRLVAFEVDNIEVFLILYRLLLNNLIVTK